MNRRGRPPLTALTAPQVTVTASYAWQSLAETRRKYLALAIRDFITPPEPEWVQPGLFEEAS